VRRKLRESGDNIGQERILDRGDPILQHELALFQPGHLQLVGKAPLLARMSQCRDRDIEIAMLAAEQREPLAQFLFVHADLSGQSPLATALSHAHNKALCKLAILWFVTWSAARSAQAYESLLGSNNRQGDNPMQSSHVDALKAKHAGLEVRLHEEQIRPAPDIAMIQQIKKQKLRIKEEIASC
jgi:hypothetical protein